MMEEESSTAVDFEAAVLEVPYEIPLDDNVPLTSVMDNKTFQATFPGYEKERPKPSLFFLIRELIKKPGVPGNLIAGLFVWTFALVLSWDGFVYESQATIALSLLSWFEGGCILSSLAQEVSTFYPTSWEYSYGHVQLEVLIAFSNCSFIGLAIIYLAVESTEHLIFGYYVDQSLPVFRMIVLSLVARFFGIYLFRKYCRAYRFMPDGLTLNFKHSLAEVVQQTIGSGRLHRSILLARLSAHISMTLFCWSCYCISLYFVTLEIFVGDLIGSFVIGIGAVACIWPMLYYHTRILLLSAPSNASHLYKCLRDISTFDGVLEIKNEHFWQHGYDNNVGFFHVRVRRDADTKSILEKIQYCLSPICQHHTVQIFRDDWNTNYR